MGDGVRAYFAQATIEVCRELGFKPSSPAHMAEWMDEHRELILARAKLIYASALTGSRDATQLTATLCALAWGQIRRNQADKFRSKFGED